MKYGEATMGQFEAVINKLGGMDGLRRFLSGELTLDEPGLADFFKTREGLEGLWVSDQFRERILAPALQSPTSTPASVGTTFDLPRDMTDADIRKELGDGHTFEDAAAFLLYLKGALKLQWGGKTGDLLNNGYANIFYVRGANGGVFAVYVYWSSGYREWRVNAWGLDDYRWREGFRAFPPQLT